MMKHMDDCGGSFSAIGKRESTRLHWDDARVFLAIARRGTLSGAAADIGTGLATVSRRIERLEHALGVPLFSRHQSGYRMTARRWSGERRLWSKRGLPSVLEEKDRRAPLGSCVSPLRRIWPTH
jgi:biotin operon repressor